LDRTVEYMIEKKKAYKKWDRLREDEGLRKMIMNFD
jgi:hypothetical protein